MLCRSSRDSVMIIFYIEDPNHLQMPSALEQPNQLVVCAHMEIFETEIRRLKQYCDAVDLLPLDLWKNLPSKIETSSFGSGVNFLAFFLNSKAMTAAPIVIMAAVIIVSLFLFNGTSYAKQNPAQRENVETPNFFEESVW